MTHRCPEPVGPLEIQHMLGLTRERVAQLRRKADFPEVWKHLGTGVVYRDDQIKTWARETKRKLHPYE